jgi:hypothetical protein
MIRDNKLDFLYAQLERATSEFWRYSSTAEQQSQVRHWQDAISRHISWSGRRYALSY